jgi:DNA-binding LacI/PurR family transcriptional regulator
MYAMPSHDSLRRPKSFWEQALFGYVQELATEGIGNVFIPDHQAAMLADLPADVVVFFNLPQGAGQGLAVPHGVPTVRVVSATDILNGAVATMHGANVVWDSHAALGEVFTHLLASGAQSPGLLLPPKPLMPTALIRQAHEDWCRRHGRGILRSESADVTAGARELLARGCDGFVVHGDDAAGDIERVMDAIRSAGRDVPRDVLLASISDGRRESAMQPAVTTISYDGMASGILIARVVIEGLQTGRFHDTELEWELQPRASTAR